MAQFLCLHSLPKQLSFYPLAAEYDKDAAVCGACTLRASGVLPNYGRRRAYNAFWERKKEFAQDGAAARD